MNASRKDDDELVKTPRNNGAAGHAAGHAVAPPLWARSRARVASSSSRQDVMETILKSCLVHGMSGTGKTALLQGFSQTLEHAHIVLRGKNDQYTGVTTPVFRNHHQPFEQLSDQLQPKHERDMHECLKFEASILTKLIPSFSKYCFS